MPLYEYQCDACGRRFERIQKFSDPPVEVCPTCGGHVRKLVSSPAFQFKGTGWYVTDYSRKNKDKGDSTAAPAASSDKGGDKAASESGKGGADAKPAAAGKDTAASSSKDSSSATSTKS
jgi:putative FmdB family regulatory protein